MATNTIGNRFGKPDRGWRERLYTIIFEADTEAGRRFDTALLLVIVLSVATVIIDSVGAVRSRDFVVLNILEWLFTILFTVEYVVRLLCVKRPLRYALSLFGIIDLLSILPTYLAILLPEFHFLIDVRLLRMLRVFRVLKLPRYFDESQVLWLALRNSRHKIMVFLGVVLIMSVILGTIMYVIEGPENGFTSIPVGMYWSIVTLTTTGYGDIHPKTPLGQLITSCAMLLGYGIIALPTGIVGVELAMTMMKGTPTTRTCTNCLTEGHEADALFCKHCGDKLEPYQYDAVVAASDPSSNLAGIKERMERNPGSGPSKK
ncbi:ion transport family protein [Collimonas arenae]|uniref:Ion transport family protein n=1 Tax=Collimonas arenae TaxID=279058 RepID=A0A127PT62_9BURK|nr:ion transporter [Collimonas arenae]AMP01018.1 ion transport family protein [Collimonas arenae]AMP10910.1 ion transport family protein [Collimonas arenae]